MHSISQQSRLFIIVLLTLHLKSIASFGRNAFVEFDVPRAESNGEIEVIPDKSATTNIDQIKMRVRRGSSNRPAGGIEIRVLIDQVNHMKAEFSRLQNSSYGDKYRIATLESELESVTNALDDANRDIEQKTDRLMHLMQLVQNLQSQLNRIQYNFPDIVENITNRRFTDVEEKLEQINQNGDGASAISEIITMAYNGQADNFDVIIDLTVNFKSSELRSIFFDVITDLVVDMMTNGVRGQFVVHDIKPNLFEIMTKIHNANASVSVDVVERFVGRVYSEVKPYNILTIIVKLPHEEQKLTGCMAFFDEMKRNDEFRSAGSLVANPVIDFAYYIRYLREQQPNIRHHLDAIKSQLPKTASALAFGDTVCIKSKSKDRHVYADYLKYDDNKRKVFVFKSRDSATNGRWHVERDGSVGVEGFRFKNVYYNEHLSAYDGINYFRITTVAGTELDRRDNSNVHWSVLYFPDDSVHMLHRFQYMNVAQEYDSDRYDMAMGTYPFNDPNSRWFIEEC